jgi:DNA repair protein RadA/Sms
MVIAVLEARCGVSFAGKDIYLNVAGGLKISEPAADLGVAAALLSALSNIPFPKDFIVFGEIGLVGEIRPVSQMASRLKEAEKLGFKGALTPPKRAKDALVDNSIFKLRSLKTLMEIFEFIGYDVKPKEMVHGTY